MAQFLPQSPFVTKLGVVSDRLEDGQVRLRLPWDPSNTTLGDMVHGGAIATLADLTVMAAAWCGATVPDNMRGVTVSMALEYLAPARATDCGSSNPTQLLMYGITLYGQRVRNEFSETSSTPLAVRSSSTRNPTI